MRRIWGLLLLLPALTGCAMCQDIDDYNYSAYGGTWQRDDMSRGRVGSAFGYVADASGTVRDPVPSDPAPSAAVPSEWTPMEEIDDVIDGLPTPEASILNQP